MAAAVVVVEGVLETVMVVLVPIVRRPGMEWRSRGGQGLAGTKEVAMVMLWGVVQQVCPRIRGMCRGGYRGWRRSSLRARKTRLRSRYVRLGP